jgi:hypothetical protein
MLTIAGGVILGLFGFLFIIGILGALFGPGPSETDTSWERAKKLELSRAETKYRHALSAAHELGLSEPVVPEMDRLDIVPFEDAAERNRWIGLISMHQYATAHYRYGPEEIEREIINLAGAAEANSAKLNIADIFCRWFTDDNLYDGKHAVEAAFNPECEASVLQELVAGLEAEGFEQDDLIRLICHAIGYIRDTAEDYDKKGSYTGALKGALQLSIEYECITQAKR